MSLNFETANLEYRKRSWDRRVNGLERLFLKLPKKPSWICYGIYDTARLKIMDGLLLRKPKEELHTLLRLMLESGIGMFTMLSNPGKAVSFQIGDVKVDTIGTTEVRDGNYLIWMSVVDIAIILRDGAAFNSLMEIPEEPLLAAHRPQGDDFNFKYFRYYRSMYHREINQGNALLELYEATDPKNLKVQTPLFVLTHWVPIIDIHFAVLKRDGKNFNLKLESAILEQKRYHKAKLEQEDIGDGDMVSFDPSLVAAASFGSQRGLKMAIESDYLPRWMIEGDFSQ